MGGEEVRGKCAAGCTYCLSAHTYLGKNLAKLDARKAA